MSVLALRMAYGAPAFNNTRSNACINVGQLAAFLLLSLLISDTVAKSTQHASNALCVLAAARRRALNNNVYICYTEAKRGFSVWGVCVSLFVRGAIMSVVLEDSVDWRWQQYTRHAHRTEGANGCQLRRKKPHTKVDHAMCSSSKPSRDTFRVPLDGCHIIVHE